MAQHTVVIDLNDREELALPDVIAELSLRQDMSLDELVQYLADQVIKQHCNRYIEKSEAKAYAEYVAAKPREMRERARIALSGTEEEQDALELELRASREARESARS